VADVLRRRHLPVVGLDMVTIASSDFVPALAVPRRSRSAGLRGKRIASEG